MFGSRPGRASKNGGIDGVARIWPYRISDFEAGNCKVNNKSTPINILLQDQFPISTNADIEVDETSNGGAEVEKETKILSWKLEIPERTEMKRQFGFQIKYPRGQRLVID
nr:DUF4139 domain-containing protein [Cytophagales bacterium]